MIPFTNFWAVLLSSLAAPSSGWQLLSLCASCFPRATTSTWPAGDDAAIAGMQISWDQALLCRQLWQRDVLLGQAHMAILAPSLSASAEESRGPYRCLKKLISGSTTSFFVFAAWAAQVNCWNSILCWNWSASFFCFLNIFLAAKETWCRKSNLDSLHMAPVAKETAEDACRPLCRALKCSCALGGLRSTWVNRLRRKPDCYFSFCLISWRSSALSVWDWFSKIIAKRVSPIFP